MSEKLTLDKLKVKDVPSIHALGLAGAEALKAYGMAVFMPDVLGQIHVVTPSFVTVNESPRVPDSDLDEIGEDSAIQVMTAQGDKEDTIVNYLRGRATRKGN